MVEDAEGRLKGVLNALRSMAASAGIPEDLINELGSHDGNTGSHSQSNGGGSGGKPSILAMATSRTENVTEDGSHPNGEPRGA